MSTRVSATAAARSFSDLLNRARYQGERFTIVRGGEAIAELGPALDRPTCTLAELVAALHETSGDDGFPADLEAVQREQSRMPDDPWAS